MSASVEKLMILKKEIGEIRDKGIKARATMEEVQNNIEHLELELKNLGIKDPANALLEIEAMEEEANKIYSEILEKMEKFK